MRRPLAFLHVLAMLGFALLGGSAAAQSAPDLRLGAGDAIRVQVFQNPDLALEARVSESGVINYPLVGPVEIGGLSIAAAEKRIADALRNGGFLKQPQVNIVLAQVRGSQVAVLGHVNRPGRYALDAVNLRVTDLLAMAGGTATGGDDVVVLAGTREGKPFRKSIDIAALFMDESSDNATVAAGDTLFVQRAAVFYIYGEVQHPGPYRLERGLTMRQALATGGGPTARGSENRLRLHRKNAQGVVQQSAPDFSDAVRADDVLFVRESLF